MADNVFIICDGAVRDYAAGIAGGAPSLCLSVSEERKTLGTVQEICRWLLSVDAGRDALLLAVGGGVTTDLVGFTASVYKRGVRYANYPTTLLAMVDAAVGGKTAVNLDGYKNAVGAFLEPEYVRYDFSVLETLPGREFRAGLAEMLKTFLIGDERAFGEAAKGLDPGSANLETLVGRAAEIKREIVAGDPFDRGERRKLNLGHTVAHALEWKYPGKYLHGEAVAIGLAHSAEASARQGLCPESFPSVLRKVLREAGLPADMPCGVDELLPAILNDKKAADRGTVVEPFIIAPGSVVLREINVLDL